MMANERGFLGSLVRGLMERRFHVSQQPPGWIMKDWGYETASGVNVTPEGALASTAVLACVRLIAETTAGLPFNLYRRLSRGRERAENHPLYEILHDMPNPEMAAISFREALTGHICSWGNAYAEIQFDGAGRVAGLWPLRPDRMRIEREEGQIYYYYRIKPGDPEKRLPAYRILHIPGFGSNGLTGYSPILLNRQAVGLSLATEEYGARFFGNGANPGGVLTHPKTVSEEAHKRMRKDWEDMHGGLDQSHRIAILEEGVTYQKVGVDPEAAQFLETRKFQAIEIARMFRVPPHLIGELDRATFSNIEHQGIEFVTYTLDSYLERWEQAVYLRLLTKDERKSLYAEHQVNKLLRGDTLARYQAYHQARVDGWMNGDEIRELENMNPMPEGAGQIYWAPLNMVPADQLGLDNGSGQDGEGGQRPGVPGSADEGGEAEGEDGQRSGLPERRERATLTARAMRSARSRHRLQKSYRRVYLDVAARVLRRETNDVRNAANKYLGTGRAKRDSGQFYIWLEEFYREHEDWTMRQMQAVAMAYAEAVAPEAQDEVGLEPGLTAELERWIRSYAGGYAARHAGISQDRIRRAIEAGLNDGNLDPLDELEAELGTWEGSRAANVANEESTRFNNALAKAIYVGAGVLFLRSVAFGSNCPYCTSLDGKVVGIHQWFIPAGGEVAPEGVEPLKSSTNVGHAPYHGGCDCMVIAA